MLSKQKTIWHSRLPVAGYGNQKAGDNNGEIMNCKSWPDEDLRRVLLTDPDDTLAICEAAERFAKQEPEDDSEERTEFDIAMECPECQHEWDEVVEFNDYRDRK